MPTSQSSPTLRYEGLFSVGKRIRAYDYPIKDAGVEVYLEGEIVGLVSVPFKAYQVKCDVCTHRNRTGQVINVPMERVTLEFDDRIVGALPLH